MLTKRRNYCYHKTHGIKDNEYERDNAVSQSSWDTISRTDWKQMEVRSEVWVMWIASLQWDKSEMTWGDSYADKTGKNNLCCFEIHDEKKNVDCRNPSKNARVISMKYEIKFSSSRKKLKIKKLKKNLSNIQDAVIYKLLRTGGKIFGSW